jgi:hypothetical protein
MEAKMSRDPHEATKENCRMVRYLAGLGQRQDDIAAIIGCSEKTLRLYYRRELDEGLADAIAAIVSVMLDLMRKGNVTLQIFYDKCRGGKRQKPDAVDKPTRMQTMMVDIPCEIETDRCGPALKYMWNWRFGHLTRQQAIAAIRAEIATQNSISKDFLQERQRLIDEFRKPRVQKKPLLADFDVWKK